MGATDAFPEGAAPVGATPGRPGGLLDVLGVAAVMLDADGRITLWSPQAEQLFGWSAKEALGRPAAQLLVGPEHFDLVLGLFSQVMAGGESWAGVFPVQHKDGTTRLVEFRNMRLLDERGETYALGIATDQAVLRRVERDLALSVRLVAQSPIGLAVLDTSLRFVMVNPALERINDLPADQHLGRDVREALSFLDTGTIVAQMREVLDTGTPLLDQFTVGRTAADPHADRAWSVSYYRLEDPHGRVLGLATSVVDVTEQHRAATEAARARRRLAVIADASATVGTTLDVDQTAHELADVIVPELADLAAVDVLDAVLDGRRPTSLSRGGPARFRALAVATAYSTEAVRAADPTGQIASYEADRLITRCVTEARPVRIAHVGPDDLPHIAPDEQGAALLGKAGLHSYLAVPLIARGEVLGALSLYRVRNPEPFDEDDAVLAVELAARAAVCIDNARSYQSERRTALTLQRHLMNHRPPQPTAMEIAYRYQPAQAASEVGGDWFDAIPVTGDKTALVVGDVMGSGINAAATMGQLRTTTRALADLDLDPAEVLRHLDHIAGGLDPAFATCLYAVYDPHRALCRIAVAGHLPPIVVRPDRPPELLDLPTGAPLGVGGVPFEQTTVPLRDGDLLVLYTDGLIETRDQPIDTRLDTLLELLAEPERDLEGLCDRLLAALRDEHDHDDVALLIARVHALGA
ncbi:PAS domain S-box-containing protein [Streptomyces sp. 2224.1]|uniref:SpoIIE family protein phosphatase n=1 Tax=unclassified Streptomyces TaxID=2593676 RepID=UPI00088CD8C1|nr:MULTISPECIES: SpoIIE family protein phosphatase [unclassified Streptomyces]PBC86799.1 PAS domain S-box-containing protein [Streptomyces sp. 2321.6]SDQ72045.1 PAS domain S-box-containing protein [Streptomyces sp. KS_16]SED43940.1 PAS domain S-box-containing protein [Streptomyces sp. 2112.3]SED81459.1 PAS domain S-box-containing protein [Streptomyces sp. 2224.1]SEE09783.1 PAS domain S-box-containing protein [Streptomyces sp. 2133.1]